MAFEIPEKSEILTSINPAEEEVLFTCSLMNNFDDPNATSDTFFLLNGAYKPLSFWNTCGIPFQLLKPELHLMEDLYHKYQ